MGFRYAIFSGRGICRRAWFRRRGPELIQKGRWGDEDSAKWDEALGARTALDVLLFETSLDGFPYCYWITSGIRRFMALCR